MCMGIPMQVLELHPPRQALVHGRGETRTVDTALLDDLTVGEWVLVFIDGARERISAERAAEVDATLDLVASAMGGLSADGEAGFVLPSAMSDEQLRALTGAA
jgi:hydrogenase expression/formation protein HypC